MDKSRQRNIISAAVVLAVVLAALVATWITLHRPPHASGRPDHPLDVPVVRAPPITAPDTTVAGGPSEPNARRSTTR